MPPIGSGCSASHARLITNNLVWNLFLMVKSHLLLPITDFHLSVEQIKLGLSNKYMEII